MIWKILLNAVHLQIDKQTYTVSGYAAAQDFADQPPSMLFHTRSDPCNGMGRRIVFLSNALYGGETLVHMLDLISME